MALKEGFTIGHRTGVDGLIRDSSLELRFGLVGISTGLNVDIDPQGQWRISQSIPPGPSSSIENTHCFISCLPTRCLLTRSVYFTIRSGDTGTRCRGLSPEIRAMRQLAHVIVWLVLFSLAMFFPHLRSIFTDVLPGEKVIQIAHGQETVRSVQI
jgi:hypothetical protein